MWPSSDKARSASPATTGRVSNGWLGWHGRALRQGAYETIGKTKYLYDGSMLRYHTGLNNANYIVMHETREGTHTFLAYVQKLSLAWRNIDT